ncbi:scarecrow-like protein 14 [Rutidosis leptorrhynchoides]|uniref:scarecrow-like protein 14 n=1 Tax=Rutidosis leptorrhynchoides TaxID=125765 RepID=UPI003A99E0E2
MVMEDPQFHEYINEFTLDDENTLSVFDQFSSSQGTGYRFRDEPLDLSFLYVPSPVPNNGPGAVNSVPQVSSPDEYEDSVSKFLDQILVEENLERKESLFFDPLELQATETSLYEAIGNNYPTLQPPSESPEEIAYRSSSEYSTYSNTNDEPHCVRSDSFETKSTVTQTPSLDYRPVSSATIDSVNTHMVQNMFSDSESMLLYKRGLEEASKFLPVIKPLVIDLDQYNLQSNSPSDVVVKTETIDLEKSPNVFRGRKHFQLDDSDSEDERISKQSALYDDESAELSEMFDRILLCTNAKGEPTPGYGDLPNNIQQTYNSWTAPYSRPGNTIDSINIRTLLINCAQSVANDDCMVANEQLKQIKLHTSSSGNASQRLAHIFAVGLEARLACTGPQLYASQKVTRISAAEKLKAFQAYISACPFKKNEIYFANRTIFEAASGSSTLHIVDFGISYGFQWPILIKHLADRPGGPPKLRITGIEFPQSGFRPAERVEETGRWLTNYCNRFKVPFEYNAIAMQNWEMIKIEDLKLQRNEFLAVNALARFENLLDETFVKDNPRDGVLKLIRDMKPDMFVHSVVNGSYGVPFFLTRFKEALFHFSSLFDMFDATLDRENEQRQNYEREFYGRQVMNVIACEGPERVERPETYKQWQVRLSKAGFKPKRLDRELVSQLKSKVKIGYHKDFVFDEDGKWMLQGWKGRILYAISCWVPA